ncbi:MAG: cyclodeaminase/cyclohydrolase family protein [Lachnospiraceae bacterium]|nr:cyclodeaminase/cyclohydrolase family protein [Lachnospiraceae bacterium]
MKEFINALASKEPTPGGGGAAAVVGSLAAALGSMVANLTTGKKKYAQYQEDIDRILLFLEEAIWEIHSYIEKDAEAFGPLAEAYKIPKDDPKRAETMEKALLAAAVVPMELAGKVHDLIPVLEELEEKGSKLALSDVAVAAVCCKAAMEGAVMNVYINTKSLTNPMIADGLNKKAMKLVADGGKRCQDIYDRIMKELVEKE